MTDCPNCQIKDEQIRQLRAELERRDTLRAPECDDLPSPVEAYLAECERLHRDAQEG